MASSSISKREWMCWAGEYAREDTITLVLSAPSSAFVDLRILLPSVPSPTKSPVDSTNPGSQQPDAAAAAHAPPSPLLPNTGGPASRLEWAFAGFSESGPSPVGIPHVVHKKWVHVIDSRCGFDEEGTADEGDLWDRPGGYSLETGIMRHPATGVDVAYQEMWKEVDVKAVNREPLRYAVVLSHHNPQLKSRGMIVRVGQYCQGIYMLDREVTVERWQCGVDDEDNIAARGRSAQRQFYYQQQQLTWSRPPSPLKLSMVPEDVEEDESKEKRPNDLWRRTVKLGSRFLPCVWTFEPEKLTVGAKLMGPGEEDDVWEVKELGAW
ncbi:hypothetical protein BKA80DRAFT_306869 [Phyllosticta citrichinensis]